MEMTETVGIAIPSRSATHVFFTELYLQFCSREMLTIKFAGQEFFLNNPN